MQTQPAAEMSTTEPSLAAIFAICDHVAESGEAIRTEEEAREAARVWLGFPNKLDALPAETV